MKRLIIGLLLVLGMGIGTQVQAEENGTVTGISPVYVLVVPGTLADVLIELGTTGTSSVGTITVSEGETVTITGRIFDSAGFPAEDAVRTWEGWPGTTISLREFFYKLEIPGGSPTTVEGKVGTVSPGIYVTTKVLTTGYGTLTVQEKGPINIGSPPLPQPVLILATTTVQKILFVNVKVATLTTLRVVPEMVVGTVGTSWWTYIVWGYNEAGGSFTVPAAAVEWNVGNMGTCVPQQGATKTVFYPGTTTGIGEISASVGALRGTGTITLVPDVANKIAILPTATTMAVGESAIFVATVTDKYGNLRSDLVGWSVDGGGSISSSGNVATFSITAEGTWTITATLGTITGSATVQVIAQRVLSYLMLIPSIATVTAGGSLTFQVQGRDKYNENVPLAPGSLTWTLTPGLGSITITGTGAVVYATTTANVGTVSVNCGTITVTGTITVITGKYHHIKVDTKSLILIAGVWSGEIPAYAEDEFNNSTWFEEENGTCTGYFAGPGGDISTFPPPGDKLWFPGKVSFVSSFICKGTALRQDPNNPTTLNIVVVNRQIRKN